MVKSDHKINNTLSLVDKGSINEIAFHDGRFVFFGESVTDQLDSESALCPGQRKLLLREAENLLKDLIAQGKARGAERGYFFASASQDRVTVIDCTDAFARLFGYNLKEEILELKSGLDELIPVDLGSDNRVFYQELRQLANKSRITKDTFFLVATMKNGMSVKLALIVGVGSAIEPYSKLLRLSDFNVDSVKELFYSTVIFGGMVIKMEQEQVDRSDNVVPFAE